MDDEALAEELRHTIGELVRAVRTVDTMPSGEAAALGHLDRSGPQTTAELAHHRRVTHQSAAKTVKELLADGFVRTEPHPTDKRKLLVHLTDAGRTRLQAEREQRSGRLGTAIREALDTEEQRQLHDCVGLLARVTDRLRDA
ncbi:MarR family winged helix-turn-helix transcriptional regulator [Streptomyces sp. NPDC054842]